MKRSRVLCLVIILFCFASHNNAYATEDELQIIKKSVVVGLDPFFTLRGLTTEQFTVFSELNISVNGFSSGGWIEIGEHDSASLLFVSYSYAIEEAIISGGISALEMGYDQDLELFAEVTGREEYLGVTPSFFLATSITNRSYNYAEVRLSKNLFIADVILVNPYIEVAAGDFHTSNFELSHMMVGADWVFPVSKQISIAQRISMTVPFGELRDKSENDCSVEIGFTIGYSF